MGDEAGLLDRVDVGGQRKGHHVGLEPTDDSLGLGRAAPVGLEELDALPVVVFLPLGLEGRDDLPVDLTWCAVRRERDGG